ncbi:carboxymuconolactone decarboxylase family protein [Lysobacter sp. SG-8]|uniref:Carboxymuconolactone decarboxylase family protein n=1 Tax=Marilutibacter penaei TaxID=2759900 RepID=A0A7W3U2A2_9GAMM|nr:carboxymuconolactone decarboxylase family protein [Lysobacter penaei]MBB1087295.1 carboxymuconolactone decarboxylase family protein [Lysobacter penaei]
MQTLYALDTQQVARGSDEYFTGDVQVRMLFPPTDHTSFSGAYVTFQPGARTAWHQHPAGQHMIVTDGTALTGTRDGRVITAGEGEVVWCPPGIDHWHGATAQAAMTHLVITGSRDGENVEWKEKVTDDAYRAGQPSTVTESSVQRLPAKTRAIVPIAAFTAQGDMAALGAAIDAGLDAGLTVNEIKEVQIHLYAYAGFPRALNGVATLMRIVGERKAAGRTDPAGPEAGPLPAGGDNLETGKAVQTRLVGQPVAGPLFDFAPGINELLQRHLFGDLFARGVIDDQARELTTVSALASMEGVEPQLESHVAMSFNVGLSHAQLADVAAALAESVGAIEAGRLAAVLASPPPTPG